MNRIISFFSVFLLFLSVQLSFAQIPNASFESWTNGEPDQWVTSNSTPDYVPFTQTNDAHQGTYAIQGTVVSIQGFSAPIALYSGNQDNGGFAINTRPEALHGWYKFTSLSDDFMHIIVAFKKNGSGIGGGQIVLSSSKTDYTEFVVNMLWVTGDVPDTAVITFQISNSTSGFPHAGSNFIVDDLSWGTATDVENEASLPKDFELSQNYPNPFNPNTTINYKLPISGQITLKVYNILGDEVATLVNEEKPAGSYEVNFNSEKLASGTYFYKLQAGSFIETKKMILLK
jgi:hypothetical protein